jgi:4,5-DOPA dioxygenase extradiol
MHRKTFLKALSLIPIGGIMMNLNALHQKVESLPSTPLMPVLFLGHGSPMNAIEENEFVKGFRTIAQTIPRPTAIVCVSAHWYTKGTFVTAMENPKTIHDFGGFPKALFDVQYPVKGSPELAHTIQQTILSTSVGLDQHWGLDHGAWSVLKHLYPNADIPVVQLSIDYSLSPQQHFDLAKQLASLRSKGILIVGSGNIVHNLGLVDFAKINEIGYGFDWAKEVREKVNKAMLEGNFKTLIQYEKIGKAMQLAVPTPDHYLPLLYTLGLQKPNEDVSLFNDQLLAGSLSMTSVKIG